MVAVATKPAMSAETRQVLFSRQANLTALTRHPAWQELEAEVQRKQERLERLVRARVFASNSEFTQREIDYLRGFANGMRYLVAVPTNAEATLERELRKQGIKVEGASE